MASQWLFEGDEPPQENAEKSKQEELFVFGYGCKVFRDDDQARLVDAGKYLIPWMGDEKLLIDRSVHLSTRRGYCRFQKVSCTRLSILFNLTLVPTGKHNFESSHTMVTMMNAADDVQRIWQVVSLWSKNYLP